MLPKFVTSVMTTLWCLPVDQVYYQEEYYQEEPDGRGTGAIWKSHYWGKRNTPQIPEYGLNKNPSSRQLF